MSKIPNFSKIELDQNIGINNEEIENLHLSIQIKGRLSHGKQLRKFQLTTVTPIKI